MKKSNKFDSNLSCSFCSKSQSEVEHLISGPCVYICEECNELVAGIIKSKKCEAKSSVKKVKSSDLTPVKIKKHLDNYVVGQDKAKEALSIAAYSHQKRINNPDLNLKKSNVMLAGPTGSGKTFMISKLAEILDVPWVTVDSSSITASGFIGGNIEDSFIQLIEKAGGDIERAKKGIVYLDEIDKIKATNPTSSKELDVGGKSVQQRFLKLLEGCEVDLTSTNQKVKREYKSIDTSNILFIASGAFVGLTNYNSPGTQDFINFGMIPEFMGRFQVKTSLKMLDVSDMKRILTEVKDNVIESYKNWFKTEKIELHFKMSAIDLISDMALKNDTGARGLQGIVENVLMPVLFKVPSMKKKPSMVLITDGTVKGDEPKLVFDIKTSMEKAA